MELAENGGRKKAFEHLDGELNQILKDKSLLLQYCAKLHDGFTDCLSAKPAPDFPQRLLDRARLYLKYSCALLRRFAAGKDDERDGKLYVRRILSVIQQTTQAVEASLEEGGRRAWVTTKLKGVKAIVAYLRRSNQFTQAQTLASKTLQMMVSKNAEMKGEIVALKGILCELLFAQGRRHECITLCGQALKEIETIEQWTQSKALVTMAIHVTDFMAQCFLDEKKEESALYFVEQTLKNARILFEENDPALFRMYFLHSEINERFAIVPQKLTPGPSKSRPVTAKVDSGLLAASTGSLRKASVNLVRPLSSKSVIGLQRPMLPMTPSGDSKGPLDDWKFRIEEVEKEDVQAMPEEISNLLIKRPPVLLSRPPAYDLRMSKKLFHGLTLGVNGKKDLLLPQERSRREQPSLTPIAMHHTDHSLSLSMMRPQMRASSRRKQADADTPDAKSKRSISQQPSEQAEPTFSAAHIREAFLEQMMNSKSRKNSSRPATESEIRFQDEGKSSHSSQGRSQRKRNSTRQWQLQLVRETEIRAAIKVQSLFRGFWVRSRMPHIRAEALRRKAEDSIVEKDRPMLTIISSEGADKSMQSFEIFDQRPNRRVPPLQTKPTSIFDRGPHDSIGVKGRRDEHDDGRKETEQSHGNDREDHLKSPDLSGMMIVATPRLPEPTARENTASKILQASEDLSKLEEKPLEPQPDLEAIVEQAPAPPPEPTPTPVFLRESRLKRPRPALASTRSELVGLPFIPKRSSINVMLPIDETQLLENQADENLGPLPEQTTKMRRITSDAPKSNENGPINEVPRLYYPNFKFRLYSLLRTTTWHVQILDGPSNLNKDTKILLRLVNENFAHELSIDPVMVPILPGAKPPASIWPQAVISFKEFLKRTNQTLSFSVASVMPHDKLARSFIENFQHVNRLRREDLLAIGEMKDYVRFWIDSNIKLVTKKNGNVFSYKERDGPTMTHVADKQVDRFLHQVRSTRSGIVKNQLNPAAFIENKELKTDVFGAIQVFLKERTKQLNLRNEIIGTFVLRLERRFFVTAFVTMSLEQHYQRRKLEIREMENDISVTISAERMSRIRRPVDFKLTLPQLRKLIETGGNYLCAPEIFLPSFQSSVMRRRVRQSVEKLLEVKGGEVSYRDPAQLADGLMEAGHVGHRVTAGGMTGTTFLERFVPREWRNVDDSRKSKYHFLFEKNYYELLDKDFKLEDELGTIGLVADDEDDLDVRALVRKTDNRLPFRVTSEGIEEKGIDETQGQQSKTPKSRSILDISDHGSFTSWTRTYSSNSKFRTRVEGAPAWIRFTGADKESIKGMKRSIRVSLYLPWSQHFSHTMLTSTAQTRLLKNVQSQISRNLESWALKHFVRSSRSLVGRKVSIDHEVSERTCHNPNLVQYHISTMNILLLADKIQMTNVHADQCFVHFYTRLAHLGEVYVSMQIYHQVFMNAAEKTVYICLTILPRNCKSAITKLILNSKDLNALYDLSLDKWSSLDAAAWVSVGRRILSQALFLRQLNYRKAVVRGISRRNSASEDERSLVYRNNFKRTTFMQYSGGLDPFLEPSFLEKRVLFQFSKKIGRHFALITVESHSLLRKWSLNVYLPSSSRTFVAEFSVEDIFHLDLSFVKKICPDVLVEMFQSGEEFSTYERFVRRFNEVNSMHDSSYKSMHPISKAEMLSSVLFEHFSPEVREDIDHMRHLRRLASVGFVDYQAGAARGELIVDEHPGRAFFTRLRVWESLIASIELDSTRKSGTSFLVINRTRSVLKEYLFRENVYIERFKHALLEIYLEASKGIDYSLFQTHPPIQYALTSNFTVKISIKSFSDPSPHQQKINLREIVNLNISDGFYKFQTNYMDSRVNLAELRNFAHYVFYKIKFSNLLVSGGGDMARGGSAKQAAINTSILRNHIRLNAPLRKSALRRKSELLEHFVERGGYIVIGRCLFGKTAKQILTTIYNQKLGDIIILLYKRESCTMFMKRWEISELDDYVPFLSTLLRMKAYKIAIDRLLAALEKYILIYSFFDMLSDA